MEYPWLTDVIDIDALRLLLQGFRKKTGMAASAYCELGKSPIYNPDDLNSVCRDHLGAHTKDPKCSRNVKLAAEVLGSDLRDEEAKKALEKMEQCDRGFRQVAKPVKHKDGRVVAILCLGGVHTDRKKAGELAGRYGLEESDVYMNAERFNTAVRELNRYAKNLETYYNAHVEMMGYIQNRTIPMTYTGISQSVPDFLSSFHEDLDVTFEKILEYLNLQADSRLAALLILDQWDPLADKSNDRLVVRRVAGLEELARENNCPPSGLMGPEVFPFEGSFVQPAVDNRSLDYRDQIDPDTFFWRETVRALRAKKALALPLLLPPNNEPIGALICFPEKEIWSAEFNHFRKIAEKAAVTVHVAVKNEQYDKSKQFSDGLVKVSSKTGPDFYNEMARLVNKVVEAGATSIFITDRRSGYLKLAGTTDDTAQGRSLLGQNTYKLGEGITGEIAQRKPDGDLPFGEIVYDLYRDKRRSPKFAEKVKDTKDNVHSMMLTQILSPDGEVLGVIRCIDVVKQSRSAFPCFNHFFLESFKFWAGVVGIIHTLRENMRLNHEAVLQFVHEFRSGLGGVINNIELWEMLRTRLDKKLSIDSAGDALKIAKIMSQYVEEMQEASLIATGRPRATRPPRERWHQLFDDLLIPVIHSLQSMAESQRDIKIRYDSIPHRVLVDKEQMTRVISNILVNAIKYSYDPRSPSVVRDLLSDIQVTPHFDELGRLHVDFINKGIGIPEAEKDDIFEAYRRATNAGQQSAGGLGLGFFFCREIMTKHEGGISVTRCHNPTVITIWLPAYKVRH